MSETMYDCYLSQFSCMQGILDEKEGLFTDFAAYYRSALPDRIYLVGSGTSYNACAAAAPFMEKVLGIEVTAVAPTCMGKRYGVKPLIIAVSQGGHSTNTVHMIELMRAEGASVVTLTDPVDTPVGRAGCLAVALKAQNELIGPKTRGYMATVLSLYLMALAAALDTGRVSQAEYAGYLAQYEETVRLGGDYLAACQRFYDTHLEALKQARNFFFVGKGVSAKVALEDALKVLETLCYPAIGYEFEEFLHGPGCCTDERMALFLFLPPDADAERMMQAAGIISEATANCYLVSHDASIAGDHILYLPTSDPVHLSPFTDILFGQLISAVLTEATGRQRHPAVKDIFSKMGTKVRKA